MAELSIYIHSVLGFLVKPHLRSPVTERTRAKIQAVRVLLLCRLLAQSQWEGETRWNPGGPVSWAAAQHWVEPVEPGKDAAQASRFGHKASKADWKETQRKDPKNTERITSLWWPGSDVWLHKSSWIKLPEKVHLACLVCHFSTEPLPRYVAKKWMDAHKNSYQCDS